MNEFGTLTATVLTVVSGLIGLSATAGAQGNLEKLVRVSAESPFTADCNGPDFPITAAYVNAESEPYVAINPQDPSNLIVVYHVDRYPQFGANGVLAATSLDAGRSWQIPELEDQAKFTRCAGGDETNGGDFEKASDPWVDFGPDGIAYFAALGWNASDQVIAQLVSTSTTGGRTWDDPVTVIRSGDPDMEHGSRPALTADPTKELTAYVVWASQRSAPASRAGGATSFSRTTDGGKTWSQSRLIYETPVGMQTSANQIVVTSNGDLVNVFNELPAGTGSEHPRRDHIAAIRSTDGGLTWSEPVTVAHSTLTGVSDPRTGTSVQAGDSFTDIAVDPRPESNTIYAVWGDARFNEDQTHQIAFAKSTDGGETWSDPVAVSTDQDSQAFIPSIAVNDRGDVAVTFYSFSVRAPRSRALMTRYWFSLSQDQGETWSARQQVIREPFDLRTVPYNGGFFFGEYQGLAGSGRSFVAVATIANGRSLHNRTDIYACTLNLDDQASSMQGGSAGAAAFAC